jgi:hypothetical protein
MPEDMTEIEQARRQTATRREPPPAPPPDLARLREHGPVFDVDEGDTAANRAAFEAIFKVPWPVRELAPEELPYVDENPPIPAPEQCGPYGMDALWKRAMGEIEEHRPEGPVYRAGESCEDVNPPPEPPPTYFALIVISPRSPRKVSAIEIGSAEDWQMMANELAIPHFARWIEIWVTLGFLSLRMYPVDSALDPIAARKLMDLKLPKAESLLFEGIAPDGSQDRDGTAGATAEVQESRPDPAQLTLAAAIGNRVHDEPRRGKAAKVTTGGASVRPTRQRRRNRK